MVDPMTAQLMAQIASAAISAAINKYGTKTGAQKPPKFQRELIDQLMQGLKGQGPYAGMFSASPEAFQKGVVDPLMQQFQTQTAPGIQQKFISSGQYRGTPMETALARGGLDVQSEINKLFLPYMQGQQNRAQSAIQALLGIKPGEQQTGLTPFGAGATGFTQAGGPETLIKLLMSGGGGGGGGGGQAATGISRSSTGQAGFY